MKSTEVQNIVPTFTLQKNKRPVVSNQSEQNYNSDDQQPDPKKPKFDNYSSKSLRIMQAMGFDAQKGLGKQGQGRLEPIDTFTQKGRRGLGLKLAGLDAAANKWNPEEEQVVIKETVSWLVNDSDWLEELCRDDLDSWGVIGDKKMTINDEIKYCDPKILEKVLRSKSVFDQLNNGDLVNARKRSNPYEKIRGSIFLNRAAVKMANMDAILDFMFTNPKDEYGDSLIRENEPLYFADVCAGPGGFSEYVLWRKGWEAKGFGFTLQGENDFKLQDFFAGHPETFDAYYGAKNDGNVFDPENITSLTEYVLKQTGSGVHFMMADGGFSVEGQENIQEILSKQLYLCQCLVALSIIREKGHFVVKLFDLFTPFSVGLIYLMHKCFQQIAIIKPVTSRPANSERYLVCKWKRANTDIIQRHLFDINQMLFDNPNSPQDILELVSEDVIQRDERFYKYIYKSNSLFGHNQVVGLLKIAAYCENRELNEPRQSKIREQCLKLWKLPDEARKNPKINYKNNDALFLELLGPWQDNKDFLTAKEHLLDASTKMEKVFAVKEDWYFMPIDVVDHSTKNFRTFFMSKGKRDIVMYSQSGSWTPIPQIALEMPPNTFIYGEIVRELLGQGRSQTSVYALHIIDAIVLGGVDIRQMPLKERNKMCQKFAMALNKPATTYGSSSNGATQEMTAPIRCKQMYSLRDMKGFFGNLDSYQLKDGKKRLGFRLPNSGQERFYVPKGLLLFNDTKKHITRHYSKTNKCFYYCDTIARREFYLQDLKSPDEIKASFRSSFTNRYQWTWDIHTQVNESINEEERITNLLYRIDFENFLLR